MNAYIKSEAVEIVVIADRSGSMQSIAADAIGGFNAFLAQQQALPGEANLTLVLFDDRYEVPVERVPVAKALPLTDKTFVPRGSTALLDAIGRTLAKLSAEAPAKAIVCILTDGQENASKEFSRDRVKEAITAAEARGWQVHYLAANQDAFAVGNALGSIRNTNFAATGKGVSEAYASTSAVVRGYRGA